MNLSTAKLLPVLLLTCSCSFQLPRPAPSSVDTESISATAQRPAGDQAAECSRLRADIASAQHNQRNAPPTSNSPIIAAASVGKEDQRIEELQQRFDRLGCAKNPSATDAADSDSAAPAPQQ